MNEKSPFHPSWKPNYENEKKKFFISSFHSQFIAQKNLNFNHVET